MYFDELRPLTTKAAEYWNSAAPPDKSINAESFVQAVSLLPAKSSSDHELEEILRKIAIKLRRQLRQDDWGPSRGDQTAALRQILKQISALKRAIERLSHSGSDQFCALFRQYYEAERPTSWAELATLIYETAVDCARLPEGQWRGRPQGLREFLALSDALSCSAKRAPMPAPGDEADIGVRSRCPQLGPACIAVF